MRWSDLLSPFTSTATPGSREVLFGAPSHSGGRARGRGRHVEVSPAVREQDRADPYSHYATASDQASNGAQVSLSDDIKRRQVSLILRYVVAVRSR